MRAVLSTLVKLRLLDGRILRQGRSDEVRVRTLDPAGSDSVDEQTLEWRGGVPPEFVLQCVQLPHQLLRESLVTLTSCRMTTA